MRLLAGNVRGWQLLARTLIAVGVVALTGCAGSSGQRSAATSAAAPAGTIDIAQLDVGNYPTKPHAPLGVAGTPQSGAVIEGQRLANFTTGPWEVNSALTGFYANSALVLKNTAAVKFVLPEAMAAAAARYHFITGFFSVRDTPDGFMLENAVLLFPDSDAAAGAAQDFAAAAAAETPGPAQPVAVPGHPDTVSLGHPEQRTGRAWTVVRAFTAHKRVLLVQRVDTAVGQDGAEETIAAALNRQVPLIDQFTPTDPAAIADLPVDPTGLLARTLPVKAEDASVLQRTVYEPRGALHLQPDPVAASTLFADSGLTRLASGGADVYEARDDRAAGALADGLWARVSSTGKPAAAVEHLPGSRCVDVSVGSQAHFVCLVAAGRFVAETQSAHLRDAHQQLAAQYVMLMGS